MSEILVKALEKRRNLEKQIRELDLFIKTYEELSGTNSESLETGKKRDLPGVQVEIVPESTISRRHGRPSMFARKAEAVLKDRGVPLSRAELVAELEDRGVHLPSADKPRYIGTVMWRERDTFVHIVDHGYWLKYVPNAVIGYDPSKFGDVLQGASNIKLEDAEGVFL